MSDPKLWPQERLFFELYVHALLGRPGTERFLDGVVESWVAPVAAAMVEAGGRRGRTPDSASPLLAVSSSIFSARATARA